MQRVVTLRLVGDHYVPDDLDLPQDDCDDNAALLAFTARYCTATQVIVQESGVQRALTAHVPKDDPSVAFLLYHLDDHAAVPLDSEDLDPDVAKGHVEFFSVSEAISDEYAVRVWPFLTPLMLFKRIDASSGAEVDEEVRPEALLSERRAILYGAPGAGKTTLVRRLCSELLNRRTSEWYEEVRLPVYIALRSFRSGTIGLSDIQALLVTTGGEGLASVLAELTAAGKVLFFFDGIDEVDHRYRTELFAGLQEFIAEYAQNSFLITARPAEYDLSLEGFSEFHLDGMSDSSIAQWCYQILGRAEKWQHFNHLLHITGEISSLRSNPLFLSICASLHTRYAHTPVQSGDLVDSYVNFVIDGWDEIRNVRRGRYLWDSPRKKLMYLSELAFKACKENKTSFTNSDAADWLSSSLVGARLEDILDALEEDTGIISSDRHGQWTFSHDVLRDYLAAKYVAEASDDAATMLATKWNRRSYIMSLIFAVSSVPDAERLLTWTLSPGRLNKDERASLLLGFLAQNTTTNTTLGNKLLEMTGEIVKDVWSEMSGELRTVKNGVRLQLSEPRAAKKRTGEKLVRRIEDLAKLRETKYGAPLLMLVRYAPHAAGRAFVDVLFDTGVEKVEIISDEGGAQYLVLQSGKQTTETESSLS